jgi:hypothetical protein
MEELHQKYCWISTDSAMVVEWMNQSKQRSAGKADGKDAVAKDMHHLVYVLHCPGLGLGAMVEFGMG